MRYRNMGPGWIFLPALIIALVLILFTASPAGALEGECLDPARPIHYMPFCLTEAEYLALITPKPAPVPPTPVFVSPVGQWEPLVAKYFPSWAIKAALWVIGCETGWTGDPWAWNSRSGASGLFQHMPRYWGERSTAAGWGGSSIFSPEANVAVAAWLWGQTGTWAHWSCKP